jgi:hypothetical protein
MTAMKVFVSTLCIAALSSLGLSAQSSPDFSGTWTMDQSRSEAAAHGEPIGPVTVVIRQAPGEVRIETTQNGTAHAVRYLPEGTSQTVADEPLGTFRWEGPQLVTNLIAHVNQQAVTVTEVRRLNAAGTEMSVAVTLVVQHGYQSGASNLGAKNPPNMSTGTNVFLRTKN